MVSPPPPATSSQAQRHQGVQKSWLVGDTAAGHAWGSGPKSQPPMASGRSPASFHLPTSDIVGPAEPHTKLLPASSAAPGASVLLLSLIHLLLQVVFHASWQRSTLLACALDQRGDEQRCPQFTTAETVPEQLCLRGPGPQPFPYLDHGWCRWVEFYLRKVACPPAHLPAP